MALPAQVLTRAGHALAWPLWSPVLAWRWRSPVPACRLSGPGETALTVLPLAVGAEARGVLYHRPAVHEDGVVRLACLLLAATEHQHVLLAGAGSRAGRAHLVFGPAGQVPARQRRCQRHTA